MDRTIEMTKLRKRYHQLKNANTQIRKDECKNLLQSPKRLVDEFIEAIGQVALFDNCDEGFYPNESKRTSKPQLRGAAFLERVLFTPVSVASCTDYKFRILHREVSPARATNAGARASGAGGIDYIALREGELLVPILGEVKVANDTDPYYAFVQLLTYLSEMSSKSQFLRANRFLFDNRLSIPLLYDLHILLVDYNDRGKKGPIISLVQDLACAFKNELTLQGKQNLLGQVFCLKANTATFAGSLETIWCL